MGFCHLSSAVLEKQLVVKFFSCSYLLLSFQKLPNAENKAKVVLSSYCCCFLFAFISAGNILEQLASDECADYVSLVRTFLSACKDGAVKPECITVEVAVKG